MNRLLAFNPLYLDQRTSSQRKDPVVKSLLPLIGCGFALCGLLFTRLHTVETIILKYRFIATIGTTLKTVSITAPTELEARTKLATANVRVLAWAGQFPMEKAA